MRLCLPAGIFQIRHKCPQGTPTAGIASQHVDFACSGCLSVSNGLINGGARLSLATGHSRQAVVTGVDVTSNGVQAQHLQPRLTQRCVYFCHRSVIRPVALNRIKPRRPGRSDGVR